MEKSGPPAREGEHWMAWEGGADGSPNGAPYTSRFVGIGASLPERRLTSDELMASTKHRTGIDLERLTGVRERRIAGEDEDSYTLAVGARRAVSFDISNACAGMMTGTFLLNDMIRQGRIRRGMVVSGEYISQLGVNAAL